MTQVNTHCTHCGMPVLLLKPIDSEVLKPIELQERWDVSAATITILKNSGLLPTSTIVCQHSGRKIKGFLLFDVEDFEESKGVPRRNSPGRPQAWLRRKAAHYVRQHGPFASPAQEWEWYCERMEENTRRYHFLRAGKTEVNLLAQ